MWRAFVFTDTGRVYLDRIALTKAGEEEIVKNGGVEALLRAIAPEKETHEEMLTPVFRLLERISKDPKHMQKIRENDGVEVLVRQLEKHTDNEVVLRAGGRLLAKIAEGDLEETIKRLNAGNLSDKAKELAVALISNLALQPENIEEIMKKGGIVALVKNFDKFNVKTKAAAARALQRIAAKNTANVDELIESGALDVLIEAIKNPENNEELLTAATQALTEIARSSLKHATLVDEKGGVVAVVEALKKYSTMSRFSEAALEFIETLCGVGFNQDKISGLGAVEAIIAAMRTNAEDAELHLRGHLALLGLVSYDDSNANREVVKKILLANGAKVLCDSINTHAANAAIVKAAVALLLALVNLDKSSKDHILKSNGITSIVRGIFVQYQQEFLGRSIISRDADYERSVRNLLAVLVDKKAITGLGKKLSGANLQKVCVFAKVQTFADYMTKDNIGTALAEGLKSVAHAGGGGTLPLIAMAMWSVGRASVPCLDHLVGSSCVEATLDAIRTLPSKPVAVYPCLRALLMFAGSQSSKNKVASNNGIDACVVAMRSNAEDSGINATAIDVQIALATTDALASDVLFKGGVRQINKMIMDSSASPEFERACERGLVLINRVASVRQASASIRTQMVKQGTIDAVTTAMSAYPKNATIEEVGGIILAKLYDESAVETAVAEMKRLTEELKTTSQPVKTMPKLGKATATVGYLALNEKNVDTIHQCQGPEIVIDALSTIGKQEVSSEREYCRSNAFRALGQMGAVKALPSKLGVTKLVINALNAPVESVTLNEKLGVLNAIGYLANVDSTRKELIGAKAIESIVNLLSTHSTDEQIVVASLSALASLTKDKQGVDAAVKAGALDIVMNLLKNNAETMSPLMAVAALEVLAHFATIAKNVELMDNDGIIDAVSLVLDKVCGDPTKPYPKVLGAAASLLCALAINESMASRVVNKGALAKVVGVANSSQAYLSDANCMAAVSKLIEICTKHESLRAQVAKIPGVVALLTEAMDENGDSEQIVTNSSKALINLMGANPETIKEMLKEIRDLLKAVEKKPSPELLEKLLKASKKLANLALIEGIFNADDGKEVGGTAMQMYETVKMKVQEGQIKNDLLSTAIQLLARTAAHSGEKIESERAIPLLLKSLEENQSNPLVLVETLKALGNLIENDPNGLKQVTGANGIKLIESIKATTTDENVRVTAEHTLQQFKKAAAVNPSALVRDRLGAKALVQLLAAIEDPQDSKNFLKTIAGEQGGVQALMKIVASPEFRQLSPELRAQVFEALDELGENLKLEKEEVGVLFEALEYATAKEKGTILKLLGKSNFTPQVSQELLQKGAMAKLLELMSSDELKKDEKGLLAGLQALNKMMENEELAEQFLKLGGAAKVVEIMKNTDNQEVKNEGLKLLAKGAQKPQGVEGLQLGPEVIPLLAGLSAGFQGEERHIYNGLMDQLNGLHQEEGPGMITERFDNLLNRLHETEGISAHLAENGKVYYSNAEGVTSWKKPSALVNAEQQGIGLNKIAENNPELVPQVGETQLENAVGILNKFKSEPLKLKELLKALAALAVNEGNREAMLKAGVLEAVIKAMQGEDVDVEFLIAAVKLLNQFAKNKVFKEKICEIGGIAALIAIMIKYIDEEELVGLCLKTLSNLAFNSKVCVDEIMLQKGPKAVKSVVGKYKTTIPILTSAMAMLTNLMYKSAKNKQHIGSLLRKEILSTLRNQHHDEKLFKQTMRAVGAVAWVDEHVRWMVVNGVTKTLVAGMKTHADNVPVQKLAIDVIGNLASVNEEDIMDDIEKGNTQSVVDYILLEGGAKKIIQVVSLTITDAEQDPTLLVNGMRTLGYMASARANVAERLIQMGIVDLVLLAMQKYDWDEDILEESMRLIAYLCYYDAGINKVYKSDGVRIILTQMESHAEEADFALIGADALKAMVSRQEALQPVGKEIVKYQGIDTILKKVMANNMQSKDLIRACLFILIPLCTFNEDISKEVAQTGMRIILKAITTYRDDTEVLIPAFKLIGHLAFTKDNLKIIVQFGGIGLLIDAVLTHPEEFDMVKQSIKTLDNVAMASPEHSKIVQEAGGSKTIEEVMKAYEGSGHEDLLNTCKGALLSMTELEKHPARPKFMYNQRHEMNDPNVDPLQKFRNTLLTGTVMGVFKGTKKSEKHFRVSKDWVNLQWKDPKTGAKKKTNDKVKLKDIAAVHLGQRDFNDKQKKKSKPKNCFSIVTSANEKICIEANTTQDQQLWIAALEAVIETAAHNPKWLK